MLEDFWKELSKGEIHVRDNLQFELKSEYFINPEFKLNTYKQEVYLFIPSPLQINTQTYSKQQFYQDQTNLIRYKTPVIALSDMVNENYSPSPLNRLNSMLNQSKSDFKPEEVSEEIKLFAVIFRSSLRERVSKLISYLTPQLKIEAEHYSQFIDQLCSEIADVCQKFRQLMSQAKNYENPKILRYFRYVDEFISQTINEFLVILLNEVRTSSLLIPESDKKICDLIINEKSYQKKKQLVPKTTKKEAAEEAILYREGLLNRFMMEALMLKNYRFSLEEKSTNILGALAAGIAMFFYLIFFFIWNTSGFVINSFPIVILAVFLYILKDRIKEGFKTVFYKQAYRWFPDYSTEVRSPNDLKIGKLKEFFAFIDSKNLPENFLKIRNHDFHEELQALQRHETIIRYKREIILNPPPAVETRRREITTIFRLNIHSFLEKISNPYQPVLYLDPTTGEITEQLLPKVYHLNLIIRNTYLQNNVISQDEIKTFRVVLDKNGIKRVEHITKQFHD